MAKHLFRVRYTEPTNDDDRGFIEDTERDAQISDDEIRRYFPLHIFDVSLSLQHVKEE